MKLRNDPIAIVGMSCRLPGGIDSGNAFWEVLSSGRDVVSEPTERHFGPETEGVPRRWCGGYLGGVNDFDPDYFGLSVPEATEMDPQQRLLLEVTAEALADAGCQESVRGTQAGVFIGACNQSGDQWLRCTDVRRTGIYGGTGASYSVMGGRISYVFDLKGPSFVIDAACSSSLLALHLACQSLRRSESSIAIVGGVNLILSNYFSIYAGRVNLLAPDGRCKPFDASADGYGRSEACAVVVLKRQEDAERDRDPVRAIIYGSAVNQDGATNGLTAPNGTAQVAVIRAALSDADVTPAEVSLVEAHGTGTPLGDPVEIESLREVFDAPSAHPSALSSPGLSSPGLSSPGLSSPGLSSPPPCRVTAAKGNIGHTEAVAGLVGVIKTVLSLEQGVIPGLPRWKKLNPLIDLAGSRIQIATEASDWRPDGARRYAGISSFGWSGTNVHVVVGDAHTPRSQAIARSPESEAARPKFHRLALSASGTLPRLPSDPTRRDTPEPNVLERFWPKMIVVRDREAYGEIDVEPGRWPFIDDHKIRGEVVVPGTVYLAAALRAGRALNVFGSVRDVRFRSPMRVQSEGRTLQVRAEATDTGCSCTVDSRSFAGPGWTEHATGSVVKESRAPSRVDLAALKAGADRLLAGGEYYRDYYDAVDFVLGPSFRLVERAYVSSDRCLVELRQPPQDGTERGDAHPLALDACLQSVAGLLGTETQVPAHIEAVFLFGSLDRMRWAHARRRASGGRQSSVFDIVGYDADGQELVVFHGLSSLALPRQESARRVLPRVYELSSCSISANCPNPEPATPGASPGTTLFVGASSFWSHAVQIELAALGERVRVVDLPELDRDDALDPISRVVFWAPPDPGALEGAGLEALDTTQRTLEMALRVIQSVHRRSSDRPKVWMLTAKSAGRRGPRASRVAHRALWAFARTAAMEHGENWGGIIDLPEESSPADARIAAARIRAGGEPFDVQLVGGELRASRLEPQYLTKGAEWEFDPSGLYVITGGTGELGLATASFLASHGARRLGVLARRAPERETAHRLDMIRAMGVQVEVVTADVEDADAVRRQLDTLAAFGPLKGIFHCAGVLHDAVLSRQTAATLREVLGPKVLGAINVLTHGVQAGAEFAVLYSSIAGVLGSAGQANYAAANAAMDAIAEAFTAPSFRVVSVAWGPWVGGMATESARRRENVHRLGYHSMPGREAMEVLGAFMGSRVAPSIVIASVDWQLLRRSMPLVGVLAPEEQPSTPPGRSLEERMVVTPSSSRERLVSIVATALRRNAEQLNPAEPLISLGLDSLTALEIRQEVWRVFRVPVSTSVILDGMSMNDMMELLNRSDRSDAKDAQGVSMTEAFEEGEL